MSAHRGGGVPVALVLLDPGNLAVVWCNSVAAELLSAAFGPSDIVGQPFSAVMPMLEPMGLGGRIRGVAEDGEPEHLTTHKVGHRDGRTVRGSIYRLPSGQILLAAQHR